VRHLVQWIYLRLLRTYTLRRKKLERAIASLEALQRAGGELPRLPNSGKRRGRKSMNLQERAEVSERMKKYWANRRKHKT